MEKNWRILVQLLKEIADAKGISQVEIAERIKGKQYNISLTLNGHRQPTLGKFLEIADAIGVNFFFEDRDGKTNLTQLFEKAMTEIGRRPENLPKN